MSANLVPCPRCQRHHLSTEDSCPFCAAPVSAPVSGAARRARGLAGAVMAVMTPMVLAACYGSPVDKDWDSGDTGATPVDLDQDGYDSTVDCDDDNAEINPGATEVCDDTVDNDCDDKIDGDDEDCASTGG